MPRIATKPENIARINGFFTTSTDLIADLYARWQDEREYEDIADYGKVIQQAMPEGFRLVKMTKRPFGFNFTIGTEATFTFFMSSRTAGWKRVA